MLQMCCKHVCSNLGAGCARTRICTDLLPPDPVCVQAKEGRFASDLYTTQANAAWLYHYRVNILPLDVNGGSCRMVRIAAGVM